MAGKDYYMILGVPRSISLRGLRDAYRKLAKTKHPDVVGQAGTADFRDITEAYEVLSDPRRRRLHNQELGHDEVAARVRPLSPEQRPAPVEPLVPEPISILGHPDAVSPSAGELLEHLLRNFIAPPKAPRLRDLNLEVVLSPAEAAQGGELPLRVPVFAECPECEGTGWVLVFPCTLCRQQGLVEMQREVRVPIPPGVPHGSILEVGLSHLGITNLFLRLHISILRSDV